MTVPVQRAGMQPAAVRAAAPAGDPGRTAVDEAARGFAAILVGEILKVSLPSGSAGLFPSGVAGDLHRDTFVRTLADQIAAAPGFALTARLADAFGPRGRTR